MRTQDNKDWRIHEMLWEEVPESGLLVLRVVGAQPEFVPPPGVRKKTPRTIPCEILHDGVFSAPPPHQGQ